jgi:hypothetical protein
MKQNLFNFHTQKNVYKLEKSCAEFLILKFCVFMILYVQNLYTKIYKIYQTYEIYSYFIIFIIIYIYIYIYIYFFLFYFFFIFFFFFFIPCNVSRNVHLPDCLEFHHLNFLIKKSCYLRRMIF